MDLRLMASEQHVRKLFSHFEQFKKYYPGFGLTIEDLLIEHQCTINRFTEQDICTVLALCADAIEAVHRSVYEQKKINHQEFYSLPVYTLVNLSIQGGFLYKVIQRSSLNKLPPIKDIVTILAVYISLSVAMRITTRISGGLLARYDTEKSMLLSDYEQDINDLMSAHKLLSIEDNFASNNQEAIKFVLRETKIQVNRYKEARVLAGRKGGSAKRGHRAHAYQLVKKLYEEHVLERWSVDKKSSKSAPQLRKIIYRALESGSPIPEDINGVEAPEFIIDEGIIKYNYLGDEKILKAKYVDDLIRKIKEKNSK